MTTWTLLRASLRHFWPLHALVVAGVAVAVAALAGALLVGASVRGSLRDLALGRLGQAQVVVSSPVYFSDALAERLGGPPLVALEASAVHDDTGRVAARVAVFGVDARFARFHGLPDFEPSGTTAFASAGLAAELGAAEGDRVMVRVARPTDIPLGSLQGRREDAGERLRVTIGRILPAGGVNDFSLQPSQGPALTLFVALDRLQRSLDVEGRANVILAAPVEPQPLARTLKTLQAAALPEDYGLRLRPAAGGRTLVVESRAGLLAPAVADAVLGAARDVSADPAPVLTHLANAIRANGREIPYSVVSAVEPRALLPGRQAATLDLAGDGPPIWLNEWAATDLAAAPGDEVELEYYLWSDEAGLETRTHRFVLAGVVPMDGLGGDPTLTPAYPGITDADDVLGWDPPFPLDLSRVRPKDEEYWDTFRAAPKAFVPLDTGQAIWPSPHGRVSSVRLPVPDGVSIARQGVRFETVLRAELQPADAGVQLRDARAEALAAADGTTDFGEYFSYFSFFLVVSGLLLAGLFFALGVEQRAREIGLLGAVGFAPQAIRRLLLAEALLVAGLGSLLGAAVSVGFAAGVLYGLRTWWVGAVGTTALTLHLDPLAVAAGTVGAFAAAMAALALSFRHLMRLSTRALLLGATDVPASVAGPRRARVRFAVAGGALALAVVLLGGAAAGVVGLVPAFFGSGGLLLVAGLAGYAGWLWRPGTGAPARSVAALGLHYTRWRPSRSVLSASLIAFACFVLVAVGAFRRDAAGASLARDSGTGGYVLMAEAVAPLMFDPNTDEGRANLGLPPDDPALDGVRIARLRLKPGDEASCLTLYKPTNPRIVAPEPAFVEQNRFAFSASLAASEEERENPWRLLARTFPDGAVPAIVDHTSLTYVFHLAVGDDFVLEREGAAPVRLRIVGALADSVLQSEMIVGEDAFVRLFPREEGYRLWLVEAPEAGAGETATLLEDRLSDFGVDLVDTRARLAAYHQVENTYLSTFQALGGLGLLVGTLGLAAVLARNVLERRRELAVLGAIGYRPGHLRLLVTAESAALVGGGLVLGAAAAALAIWPALADRAQALPLGSLALLLGAVVVTGLLAALAAARVATSTAITEALKTE